MVFRSAYCEREHLGVWVRMETTAASVRCRADRVQVPSTKYCGQRPLLQLYHRHFLGVLDTDPWYQKNREP